MSDNQHTNENRLRIITQPIFGNLLIFSVESATLEYQLRSVTKRKKGSMSFLFAKRVI